MIEKWIIKILQHINQIWILKILGAVWLRVLNNNFHRLNNITHIFTHFFIYTYFQKIQTTLLEPHYQTALLIVHHLSFSIPSFNTLAVSHI